MYNSVYIDCRTATIIIYQRLDLAGQNSDFCAYRYFMATKPNLFDSAYKQETGGPFSKLIHKSSLRGVVCLGGRYKCAYFQLTAVLVYFPLVWLFGGLSPLMNGEFPPLSRKFFRFLFDRRQKTNLHSTRHFFIIFAKKTAIIEQRRGKR